MVWEKQILAREKHAWIHTIAPPHLAPCVHTAFSRHTDRVPLTAADLLNDLPLNLVDQQRCVGCAVARVEIAELAVFAVAPREDFTLV